jgi:hypothetical protein
MEGFRTSMGSGRQEMLDALAPHVASIGLDTAYELIEEIAPVRV